jgi:hypothetical protein
LHILRGRGLLRNSSAALFLFLATAAVIVW